MLLRSLGLMASRSVIVAMWFAAGIAALSGLSTATRAAEPSHLVVLGFSGNGRYFAFAETAAQGESGRAGGQVTLIDVARDRLLTPAYPALKVRDAADATAAMARLERQSRAALGRFGIPWPSAARTPIAAGAVADIEGEEFTLDRLVEGDRYTARSASLPLTSTGGCPVPVKGLEIVVQRNGQEALRQRDASLPASRGCPVGYAAREILARKLPDGSTALAVLVAYDRLGSGGLARSHIAITRLIAR